MAPLGCLFCICMLTADQPWNRFVYNNDGILQYALHLQKEVLEMMMEEKEIYVNYHFCLNKKRQYVECRLPFVCVPVTDRQ